jgi:hypothetical protein
MDVYKYQQSNDKLGLKSHEDFEQIEFVLGKEFENTPPPENQAYKDVSDVPDILF